MLYATFKTQATIMPPESAFVAIIWARTDRIMKNNAF